MEAFGRPQDAVVTVAGARWEGGEARHERFGPHVMGDEA